MKSGCGRVVGVGGWEVLDSKLGECKKKELFFEKFEPIYGGKKPPFLVLYYRRFWSTFNNGNLSFYDGFTFSDTRINGGNETAINTAVKGFNGGKKPPLKPNFGIVWGVVWSPRF